MICKGCGKKHKYKEVSNMGDNMKATGWTLMINHKMKTFWYCKDCTAKLKEHFKIVYDILGDDYIAYSWLVKLVKEKKNEKEKEEKEEKEEKKENKRPGDSLS